MKRKASCGLLGLALWPVVWARAAAPLPAAGQDQQNPPSQPGQPSQPSGQNPQQQPPPTLERPGDENQPSLGEPAPMRGPHSANISDVRRLLSIKTVYVEDMDNKLNESLAANMADKKPFQVVADRRLADALLHGSCLDSARKKIVDSEVYLTGRHGEPIWMDIVRRPYHPPPLSKAVASTAAVIVEDLKTSIQEAQR